tara:strand:+ start:17519 stop:17656 length:138 start_codon:yes stop_codon:yes gene_type:complete
MNNKVIIFFAIGIFFLILFIGNFIAKKQFKKNGKDDDSKDIYPLW